MEDIKNKVAFITGAVFRWESCDQRKWLDVYLHIILVARPRYHFYMQRAYFGKPFCVQGWMCPQNTVLGLEGNLAEKRVLHR